MTDEIKTSILSVYKDIISLITSAKDNMPRSVINNAFSARVRYLEDHMSDEKIRDCLIGIYRTFFDSFDEICSDKEFFSDTYSLLKVFIEIYVPSASLNETDWDSLINVASARGDQKKNSQLNAVAINQMLDLLGTLAKY